MTLLDDLKLLRADALALARRVAAVRAGGRGVDPSGAVEVMLGPDGWPDGVRLRPEWRGAVGPGGLAGAVREAWSAAALDRLGAWAAAATDPDGAACTQAEDGAPRGQAAHEGVDGPSPLPAALVGQAAGRDPGGRVTVEVSGGELVALCVDEGWARLADDREIGAVVRAALAEAFSEASGAVDGSAARGGTL
ncbi:hypothetical protein [Micromonospora sp. CPCC 206061]|uniref:hypothetical protein n=1 Tax=Micromonospora sp. CPCC 206061 TaxID=3122410 RepID=UPI002FF25B9E